MPEEVLKADDIIILLMGPNDCGKTTFVRMATGIHLDMSSYSNWNPRVDQLNLVKLSSPERSHGDDILINTPGFNDSFRTSTDILEMVADWLASTFRKKKLLSGILYFHRITDKHMPGGPCGSPVNNNRDLNGTALRMFEHLCGKTQLRKIVLTTTMWNLTRMEVGVYREEKLRTVGWKDMLARQAEMRRFWNTRGSAVCILGPLIDEANYCRRFLRWLKWEMEESRNASMGFTPMRHIPETLHRRGRYSSPEVRTPERVHRVREEDVPSSREQPPQEYLAEQTELEATSDTMSSAAASTSSITGDNLEEEFEERRNSFNPRPSQTFYGCTINISHNRYYTNIADSHNNNSRTHRNTY
ncbi:hypothetical protein BDZ97DRAFT_1925630 [Flammula alnicola]|nr:hypothetical protein BDZ97DRAFT_1925630 [Flammula alnicola]